MSVDLEAVLAAELKRAEEHRPASPSALFSRLDVIAGLLREAPPTDATSPRLLWRTPDGTVQSRAVDGPLLVGRDPECDVVLAAPHVSRRHARITAAGSAWRISDLASANGTEVNGQRLGDEPRVLLDGDVIAIGGVAVGFVR